MGIRGFDAFVVMRIRFDHLEAEFRVKVYGAFVVHLDVTEMRDARSQGSV